MTNPAQPEFSPHEGGYRQSEVSAVVGNGVASWERASHDVLYWKIKTASGFTVDSSGPVVPGENVNVTARMFGISVVEPVQVVSVVQEKDRVGFAYKTLPGHPVSGEEAFIVHRHGDEVRLSVRSLTRPSPQQPWRMLYPLLLIIQRIVRRRYLRALR